MSDVIEGRDGGETGHVLQTPGCPKGSRHVASESIVTKHIRATLLKARIFGLFLATGRPCAISYFYLSLAGTVPNMTEPHEDRVLLFFFWPWIKIKARPSTITL